MKTELKGTKFATLTVDAQGNLVGFIHADAAIKVFQREDNVRDQEHGYEDVLDTLQTEIERIGRVTDPVHVHSTGEIGEFAEKLGELTGLKGFRRTYNVRKLIVDGSNVSPWIPIKIMFGMSPEEIVQYRQDHGTQKGLNQYEAMLCIKERLESGFSNRRKEIVWDLRNLLVSHMPAQKRQDYEALIKKCETQKEMRDSSFDFLKGRFQKLQRIAEAKEDWVRDNFRAEVYGLTHVKITDKNMITLAQLSGEEFTEALDDIKSAKAEKDSEAASSPTLSPWRAADLLKQIEAWEGTPVAEILKAVRGEAQAQASFKKVANAIVAA